MMILHLLLAIRKYQVQSADPSLKIADLLGDEKMGLLVPHYDFSVRDIKLDGIAIGIQHPKGLMGGNNNISDIAHVGLRSEGLEEKI
jgi:hypothetical protein